MRRGRGRGLIKAWRVGADVAEGVAVAEAEAVGAEVGRGGDYDDVRVAAGYLPDGLRAALGQAQLLYYAVSHNTDRKRKNFFWGAVRKLSPFSSLVKLRILHYLN